MPIILDDPLTKRIKALETKVLYLEKLCINVSKVLTQMLEHQRIARKILDKAD